MSDRRTYTEDERARALALVRATSATRVSRDLGIPRTTLRQWAGEDMSPRPAHTDPALVDAKAREIADNLEEVNSIIGQKIREALPGIEIKSAADVRNLLIGSGIASEKASFLRGGPTARSVVERVSLIAPDALRSGSLKVLEGGKKTA